MRIFWLIVAVLVGVAVGVVVFPSGRGAAPRVPDGQAALSGGSAEPAGSAVSASRASDRTMAQGPAATNRPAAIPSEVESPPASPAAPQGHDADQHAAMQQAMIDAAAQESSDRSDEGLSSADEESGVAVLPGGLGNPLQEALRRIEEVPGAEQSPKPEPAASSQSLTGVTEAPATQSGAAAMNVTPSRVETKDDGTKLLDERFVLSGSGTADDPYVVTWDLLVSVSDTYRPRQGRRDIPERVWMLHDKHVRITGFIAFPIMAQSPNEMLSMLNQWDGCCIGTPPTPYDAIEVRLGVAASSRQRFLRYGQVEGVLKVDPYVRGDWLLGLYLMEDARIVDGKREEL